MYLAIDVGNTRSKIGVYDQRKLVYYTFFKQLTVTRLNLICSRYDIHGICVCVSGSINESLKYFFSKRSDVLFLRNNINLPIKIGYKSPQTLGKDRIAAAIGAYMYDGKKSGALIINMGTCITMDYIDDHGVFQGGNISPGVSMRIQAMHKFTARLPLVEKNVNDTLLGYNTTTALQNGAIGGAKREIESFIDEINEKYQQVKVFVSGGDAQFFVEYTKKQIFARPYIVLEGLIETLIHNGI
jgi:type III pantothenate kinase